MALIFVPSAKVLHCVLICIIMHLGVFVLIVLRNFLFMRLDLCHGMEI